jgi:3-keto-disaccharide hydrolase
LRPLFIIGITLCIGCTYAAELVNFDKAAPGGLPPGWTSAMTHSGGPPRWEVLRDGTAPSRPNVLAQVSNDPTAGRFPLAIYDNARLADGSVSVRFKTVSGAVDQAAGLVWRYRNPENYYIARANALEDNVVLYKVENGQRVALAPRGRPSRTYGVKHDIPKGVWNTLTVEFNGDVMKVALNGEALFEVVDSTFAAAGKVGVWTKADSVTYFDDLRIVPATGSGRQ